MPCLAEQKGEIIAVTPSDLTENLSISPVLDENHKSKFMDF